MTESAAAPDETLPPRFRSAAAWLRAFASGTPDVVAAYVGGSLVNDRVDADSDIDANLVTREGREEAVFDALLQRLHGDWEVQHVWVLPSPTWHGGHQLFAQVAQPDGPLVVDLVVDRARPAWLEVDPRRHGPVLVLHDPEGRVRVEDGDDQVLRRAAEESARQIAERLPVAEWLVMKAVRRGHWPEAYAYQMRLGVDALVQLLRTRHTPARWDFGLRYLDDLPDDVAARVLTLLPGDRERLGAQVAECFAWQRELLAELDLR